MRTSRAVRAILAGGLLALLAVGCTAGPAGPTPVPSPGTSAHPRDVNIIARDYTFDPSIVDLSPGETVTLHVINAGLVIHEAIIGDAATQDAWEVAEATAPQLPPGPTPVVSVPPGHAGLRIVVESGQRVDVVWTVPADAGISLIVGCHIPGHWAKGMYVPVRFFQP